MPRVGEVAMRRPIAAWVAAFLALLARPCAAAAADVADVWAVNDGEKIPRDDPANPNRGGNSVWDGRSISLFTRDSGSIP